MEQHNQLDHPLGGGTIDIFTDGETVTSVELTVAPGAGGHTVDYKETEAEPMHAAQSEALPASAKGAPESRRGTGVVFDAEQGCFVQDGRPEPCPFCGREEKPDRPKPCPTLTGRVVDKATGCEICGAQITVRRCGCSVCGKTGMGGRFSILLYPGWSKVSVSIEKEGYDTRYLGTVFADCSPFTFALLPRCGCEACPEENPPCIG